MALVRCPIHKIPYNEDHPRGCPACAREQEGDAEGRAIQELARASKTLRRTGEQELPDAPEPELPSTAAADTAEQTAVAASSPEAMQWRFAWPTGTRRRIWIGTGIAIVVLVSWLAVNARDRFVPGRFPPTFAGEVRPLPFDPNSPISLVFATLGVQQPRPHPSEPRLARYQYGTDLSIDALNRAVFAITLAVPNRSWRGLQVGLPDRNADGALALLGMPHDAEPPVMVPLRTVGNWEVYPGIDERPRRVRQARVRPPNGCFDVTVELRPQVIGLLIDGEQRLAVIGRRGTPPEWVVTRIHVVSRALPDSTSQWGVC